MNRLQNTVSSSLLLIAFSMIVGCANGTGNDAGPSACDADADCAEGELCHLYLGLCVDDCSGDSSICTGDTPTCAGGDAGAAADARFEDICVCTSNADCATDEICNPIAGVCESPCEFGATAVAGDAGDEASCPTIGTEEWSCYYSEAAEDFACQPACATTTDCPTTSPVCDDGVCKATCDSSDPDALDCEATETCNPVTGLCDATCTATPNTCGAGLTCDNGLCVAECAVVGSSDAPCAAGQVCTEGTPNVCEAVCEDETCLTGTPGFELCQTDIVSVTYNECETPALVNGTCDASTLSALSHEAGGPVISGVDAGVAGAGCGGANTRIDYTMTVYSPNAPGPASGAGGLNGRLFWYDSDGDDAVMFDFPVITSLATADFYEIEFALCQSGDLGALAVGFEDSTGLQSNVACFSSDF